MKKELCKVCLGEGAVLYRAVASTHCEVCNECAGAGYVSVLSWEPTEEEKDQAEELIDSFLKEHG